MSFTAFLLVLISVLLHAAWHAICKSQNPFLAFYILISFSGIVLMTPFALCSGVELSNLPLRFWVTVAAGGICGALCDVGLSFAYRLSNVSLAYPLARALPVILTAVVAEIAYSFFGSGTSLGTMGFISVFVIFIGCMLMPLDNFRNVHISDYLANKALPWILLAALGTTGYTVADKFGVDLIHLYGNESNEILATYTYCIVRELILFFLLVLSVCLLPHERIHLNFALLKRWQGYLSGVFASTAYLLVLYAMALVTNVSYIQAFRQMSLPVGVVIGVFILKEKFSLPKLIGLLLILAGLIALSIK